MEQREKGMEKIIDYAKDNRIYNKKKKKKIINKKKLKKQA
jgi:hypothetical protein